MDNHELLDEFEDSIEKKYGHMAESMLMLADESLFFCMETEIDEFTFDDIETSFEEYFDYEDLTEAECSMVFQLLIEFCDFCKKKQIDNSDSFKDYLIKNKLELFENWQSTDDDTEEKNPFGDLPPEEFLENFDTLHPALKFFSRNKNMDPHKLIEFLEKTYKLMRTTLEASQEIRNKHPNLSNEECHIKTDDIVQRKHGEELSDFNPDPDEVMGTIISLPKEQSKKFFEIMFKLEKASNFDFGSIQEDGAIEELLPILESLIKDLKMLERTGGN